MAKETLRHSYAPDFIGERTTGLRIGFLYWDQNSGSGDIKFKTWFDDLSDIERLDALLDIAGLIEREYNYQHLKIYGEEK